MMKTFSTLKIVIFIELFRTLKKTTEFDIEDIGYINYVFNALCNQEIPYLDVKEYQILTDGSVEF